MGGVRSSGGWKKSASEGSLRNVEGLLRCTWHPPRISGSIAHDAEMRHARRRNHCTMVSSIPWHQSARRAALTPKGDCLGGVANRHQGMMDACAPPAHGRVTTGTKGPRLENVLGSLSMRASRMESWSAHSGGRTDLLHQRGC